jgi:hypothetical protein
MILDGIFLLYDTRMLAWVLCQWLVIALVYIFGEKILEEMMFYRTFLPSDDMS